MKSSSHPAALARPAHERIFEGVRASILSGNFAPRTILPSTRELAATWRTSLFTVNTALKALAKEGWVELRHGARTYVVDPKSRFVCAGIYHGDDIAAAGRPVFSRNLHIALVRRLELMKKDVQVFMDTRSLEGQRHLLPSLASAIRQRRIQCLFAPSINNANCEPLSRVVLPTVFMGNVPSPARADLDIESMLMLGTRHLASQGCRSVGVLHHIYLQTDDGSNRPRTGIERFSFIFEKAAREAGLATRESWRRNPVQYVHSSKLEDYGYKAFKAFWRLRQKPDALIVYPDTLATGVIVAMAEIGFQTVAKRMKFVVHENAHSPLFCPIPVTWAVSDEDALAGELVQQMMRQFAGKKVEPVLVPYTLRTPRQ